MGKNNKIKKLSQNTLLFTISGFGTRIVSFFLVPFYTYVLSTDEYGKVDLVTTTVQLLIPILTINIQDAVLRFSLDEKYQKEDVVAVGFQTICLSTIVISFGLFVLKFFGIITLEVNYILFLYVSFIVGAINNNLSMYIKAKNQVRVLAVWGITNTIITCICNLFLLLVLKIGVNGYMIAYVSGTFVADIGMFLSGNVLCDLKKSQNTSKIICTMLFYSAPLIANSLGWWINNASDRYILTYFCGAAINGVYAVSYKIPSILSALQSIFYNAWSVSSITEFDADDTDGFIGDTYTVYSSLSFLVCSLIMLLNIYIARLLYSKDFFMAWRYVPLLLIGTVFNGLGLFNGCIYTAVKRTKYISITTIISALINTLLNFLLIPIVGAYGAAFATMVGYSAIWLTRIIGLKKIIRMKVDWKCQIGMIVTILIQCVVASISGNAFYQIPFVLVLCIFQHKILFKLSDKLVSLLGLKR